jgi:hypothetical protein
MNSKLSTGLKRIGISALALPCVTSCYSGCDARGPPQTKSSSAINCDVPACSDMMSAYEKSLNAFKKTEITNKGAMKEATKQKFSLISTKRGPVQLPIEYDGTPLNRPELGKSSWNLLHTMVANYPDTPTDEQQKLMTQFFNAIAIFFPCIHCAEDFQANIAESPPR